MPKIYSKYLKFKKWIPWLENGWRFYVSNDHFLFINFWNIFWENPKTCCLYVDPEPKKNKQTNSFWTSTFRLRAMFWQRLNHARMQTLSFPYSSAFAFEITRTLYSVQILRDRFHLLFLILSEFNLWFSDDLRGNRSWLIRLNSLDTRSKTWRQPPTKYGTEKSLWNWSM